jgi:hypothetical protein
MANSIETQYSARTGVTKISVANTNLNGTGAMESLIVGTGAGTFVKTLIIKAQTETSHGMIRLFSKKGASGSPVLLVAEYAVAPTLQSGRDPSFSMTVPLNYNLEMDELLLVATDHADTFGVIAEAFDIVNSSTTQFINTSLEYKTNVGAGQINNANPNLDGSGSVSRIISASSTAQGCSVSSILISALQTTAPGMVRFFLEDSASNKTLFNEVLIPYSFRSTCLKAFSYQVIGHGSFCLGPGFSICASTERNDAFSITIEGADWQHV